MGWRRGSYVISGIAAAGLIAELAWALLDPKGDLHVHAVDHTIRALNGVRDHLRPSPTTPDRTH